jgi:hypothetical protein
MRKASCITLITTICLSISSSVYATSLRIPASLAMADERPLIPLEQSLVRPLIPLEQSLMPWNQAGQWDESSLEIADTPQNLANTLVRGLLAANRTGEIDYSASVSYRIQNVVRGLRRGESLNVASRYARVPKSVLAHLINLGQSDNKTALSDIAKATDTILYHTLANALVRGLVVANRTGEIGYAAPLSYQVQDIVRILRRGKPLVLARTRARVPNPVVDRLLQLGHYSAQVN